jgi:hypothetical protein
MKRKKTSLQTSTYIPSNIDVEISIISTLLQDTSMVQEVAKFLKPNYFFSDRNRNVFWAITRLHEEKEVVCILTVSEYLKKVNLLGDGDRVFIAELSMNPPSPHVEYHAKIIAQLYIQREVLRINKNIELMTSERFCDIYETVDSAITQLLKLKEIMEPESRNIIHEYKFIEAIKQRNWLKITQEELEILKIIVKYKSKDLIYKHAFGDDPYNRDIWEKVKNIEEKNLIHIIRNDNGRIVQFLFSELLEKEFKTSEQTKD